MDEIRRRVEQDVLKRKMPENVYRFIDMDTNKPYLVLAAKTKTGILYILRFEMDDFKYIALYGVF